MFLGLVLFGVGAGNGIGGLLNAFTGQGSSSAQKQVLSQQEKDALRATQLNPNDPSAWASLLQARWTSAGQGNDFNSTTDTYTAAGKQELTGATQAWQRYLALTHNPDPNLATLAARAYTALGQYANSASAWELAAAASSNAPKPYECLAVTAYAAGQTRKGDLATARALSLLAPGTARTQAKTLLQSARNSTQTAQQTAQQC